MKLFVTVFCITTFPVFEVESNVQFETVIVQEFALKMYVAWFSRMQESVIITLSFARIVPPELRIPCVFLRMLQLLISELEPPYHG
jgi:D-alanyl-lipoteichoic acid acyltransferase DltB (MBOAT superfamily)